MLLARKQFLLPTLFLFQYGRDAMKRVIECHISMYETFTPDTSK